MSNAANVEDRIAQWERMAEQAPDDMAYFSLGTAYRDAERHADAVGAFEKAIEHNAGMSKAYQFLGDSLIKLNREGEAKDALISGYTAAAERGDVMPKRAIAEMLEHLDVPLPKVKSADEKRAEIAATSGGRMILDKRTGQSQPKMADPPMRGPIGAYIFENFGQVTWQQWIGQGTKVINELRLDLSRPEHQDTYEQQMLEWLGITPEDIAE